MDQNSNLSLNLPPEVPSNYPLYPTPKKQTPKLKKWEFLVFPFLVIMIALWYGGYLHLYASGSPMNPNEVLDPDCAPGTPNCYVQILPTQVGNGGKFLSTNGTTTSWSDLLISFNGAQSNYRSGLVNASADANVASSTDLLSFVQNYFFPATYNVPVITPTWSNTSKFVGDAVPSIPPTNGSSEFTVTDNGNSVSGTTPQTVNLASTCPTGAGYATASGSFPTSGASTASPVTYTRTYAFKEGVNTGNCRNAGTSGATAVSVNRTLSFSWSQPTINASVSGGTTGPFEWGKTFSFSSTVTKTVNANYVTGVTLTNTAGSGSFTSIASVNGATIGSSSSGLTSQTFTSTLTPNYSSLPSGNTTYLITGASQYLSVTPPNVTASVSFANSDFEPAIYYGVSADNLLDASAFPDNTSTSSGSLSNKIQNLGTGAHLQATRALSTATYSNASVGVQKWVYFAWPSYQVPNTTFTGYEPGSVVSGSGNTAFLNSSACKAVMGDGSNSDDFSAPGTACFSTGDPSSGSVSADSSFWHRSLSNFTNQYGVTMHYELYRSEVLFSNSTTASMLIRVQ